MAQVETPPDATGRHRPEKLESGALDRIWSRLPAPTIIAVITWLVALPVAWMLPSALHVNPFTQRGGNFPLAAGGLLLIAVALLAVWRRSPGADALSGLAAGLFAAYVVLFLRSALHGTPFGFEGALGDTGRISAMATRYVHSWAASDGIVAGRPAEYPPLFPYLIGKISAVTGTASWRLMQPAQILLVSSAVLAGFALWRRHVNGPVALAIVGLGIGVYGWPNKPYEVIALMVIIPWVLSTFLPPPHRRLHWAVAGTIGGVLVLTYYTYIVFSALGLVALIWTAYRRGAGREYLVYLGKVLAVMVVLSSWFVLPYMWAMLHGGQQLDVYEALEISQSPFPFLQFTPFGMAELGGLLGLLFLRKSTFWGQPLLLLLGSAYLYRAFNYARYVATGHTGLFYYTAPFIEMVLIVGCVLSATELIARAPKRFVPSRSTLVALLAVVFAFTAFDYWYNWAPVHTWKASRTGTAMAQFDDTTQSNRYAQVAHDQHLYGGALPKYAPYAKKGMSTPPYFPVKEIKATVEGVLGKNAAPHVLSYNEQLFTYLAWPGYLGVDRGSSYGPVRWDARFAALKQLSQITDPAQFAQASTNTAFGPIDVFVLQKDKKTTDYLWTPLRTPESLRFTPTQFTAGFTVIDNLPNGTVVVIRTPK